MPESNYIDMETLVESSEGLRASMDEFLDTELKYIKYLRNREKFFIGIKSVAATPLLMMQQHQQQQRRGGGGIPFIRLPRRWPRRVRAKQPAWDPAYERVPQRVPVKEPVRVPVPQPQPQPVPVPQPQPQPQPVPVPQPQPQPVPIPQPQPQPVPVPQPQPESTPGSIWDVPPGLFPGLYPGSELEKLLENDGIGSDIFNPGALGQPGLAFSDAMALGEAWLTPTEPEVKIVQPPPPVAWQLLTGTELVKRIEYEMQNGIGSAGLPATLYERGSMHHGMALNAILAVEGLNIPEALSINNPISAENMARLGIERPEVEGGWSWFDVAQVIGTIILPFLDGPVPVGDAAAFASLANLMMKGKVTWAMVRPLIRIFGPKVVQYVKTQLQNLGVKPEMFSLSSKVSPATSVAMSSGGLLTSPVRANNILAGEAGPELVLPLSKVTDAIEAVYREGGSLMVGATQSFLANMNSPSARGVLNDANRISTILGSSPVEIASIIIPDNILKSLPKIETENNKTTIEENKKIKKLDTKGKTSETDDLSFIKDPEKRAAIELIRKLENTDDVNTGFSKWFGDKEGGMKYGNLQGMTIQQIHDLQTKFLKDPQSVFYDLDGNKKKSAAVGSGQFIYLKSDAMRLLGIDPSKQKFTPQFQVSLIEAIAKEAGVDINEKLTIEDIRKLGTKWSSLTPVNNQTTRSAAESFKEYLKILPVSENKQSLLLKPFESFSKKSINEIPIELASKNTIVELPIPIVIPIEGPIQMVPVVETEVVNRKLPLVVDTFGKGVRV